MRTVLVMVIAVVILISAGLVLVVAYSTVPLEHVCEGETRDHGGPPLNDAGRLRVSDYHWWVGLWADSAAEAIFESKKIAHFFMLRLSKTGSGNFASYMGFGNPEKSFIFRRATGELALEERRHNEIIYTFVDECKQAQ